MTKFIYILLIGISLSMDAFSLSLSLGSLNPTYRHVFKPALIVGVYHFFMPILGSFLGTKIKPFLFIDSNLILGTILIIISIDLFIHIYQKEEIDFKLDFVGINLFSLGVSLDSFSLGLGLIMENFNIPLCSLIFSLCSFAFTYLGFIIGKYSSEILGNYSKLLGSSLLLILGIIHLLK
jgi:manganese efflux pump family protein